MRRIIAAKKSRIDNNPLYLAGHTQTDDAPVKFLVQTGASAATRLPAVHPFTEIGVFALDPNGRGEFEQILLRCKKIVIRKEHGTAEFFGCEVDEIGKFHII